MELIEREEKKMFRQSFARVSSCCPKMSYVGFIQGGELWASCINPIQHLWYISWASGLLGW